MEGLIRAIAAGPEKRGWTAETQTQGQRHWSPVDMVVFYKRKP